LWSSGDVAIVLGGSIGQPLPPRITPDLSEAADRVLDAARLFRAGKVDWILVSGGNLPWQAGVKPEVQLVSDLLVEFGVRPDAIVQDGSIRLGDLDASRARGCVVRDDE
jgi:vancomycin permeability regulator SanA